MVNLRILHILYSVHIADLALIPTTNPIMPLMTLITWPLPIELYLSLVIIMKMREHISVLSAGYKINKLSSGFSSNQTFKNWKIQRLRR